MTEITKIFSLEAEQSVLGSILIDPSCIDEVIGIVKPDDFYRRAHQVIYSTMNDMVEEGCPLDLVTLTERLQFAGKLDEVGGVSYLTELAESVPTTANVDYYAQIVKDKAIFRHLKQVGAKISKLDDQKVEDAISKAESLVGKISDHYLTGDKDTIKDIDSLMLMVTERLGERIDNKGTIQGLATGFHDLDRVLSGLHKGDLIIVAARPSMGKTAFALNISSNVINNDKTVVIFSLEMSSSQLIDRLICSIGNINSHSYRSGDLMDSDFDKYAQTLSSLSGKKLFIDDKPNMTVSEIKAKCRKIKRNHGLDLVIIDYLQQIQSESDKNINRNEEIGQISRSLKIMARELDVPVIVLSQLSRAVEQRQDKRPMLSDLRDSGSIEQDADVVAFLYRDDYYNEETEKKNIAEVIISKHRNGPVGKVELLFLKEYSKFVSLSNIDLE